MSYELRRPRARILPSVLALLFLVGAIPLGIFGFRLTAFNRDRIEEQQKEHQLVLAEAIALEVGEFVRRERAEAEGFVRGLETALLLAEGRAVIDAVRARGLLHGYLEQDRELLKLVVATRASDDRRRLEFVAADRADVPPLPALVEERLATALLERGFLGEPVEEIPPGEPPVLLHVLPARRDGSVEAVVAAVQSLSELRERIAARSQQLYAVYVTDASGRRLLAHSRPPAEPSEVLDSDLVAAFRDGGGTRTMPFRSAAGERSREMLGAFATVPGSGWGVMVEIDAESAYFAVGKMREKTVEWSIASVLLALVLGGLFARHLVHPIRDLAEGAMRLSRGDFSRPIELKSRNEIGVLAESFNHMAGEIRDQMERLELAARENRELFLSSIRMLAEAIDEKDPYTRGHSERVTRFAVATARAYGLSEEEVERVRIGALLHDVGKIGIDDRILRKPTVLTDEEFEVMKQHPEKGAHIMGAIRQLAEVVPGMRFHHEKVDGSGYPLGLKGDEIPVAAQIISVSDTFDAMTTDRPYQRGMDPEFVVGKLRGWVGTRFRGDVVEAFEQAWRAGAIELRPRKGAVDSRVAASGAP